MGRCGVGLVKMESTVVGEIVAKKKQTERSHDEMNQHESFNSIFCMTHSGWTFP